MKLFRVTAYVSRVILSCLMAEAVAVLAKRNGGTTLRTTQMIMWSHYVLPPEERENDDMGKLAIKRYYALKGDQAV